MFINIVDSDTPTVARIRSQKMFLILAQFFPELLLTMCKVIRIYDQTAYIELNYKFYLLFLEKKEFIKLSDYINILLTILN